MDEKEFSIKLHRRIKLLCEKDNIYLKDFYIKAGISQNSMARLSKGYDMRMSTLIKIASTLGITISELLAIENGSLGNDYDVGYNDGYAQGVKNSVDKFKEKISMIDDEVSKW